MKNKLIELARQAGFEVINTGANREGREVLGTNLIITDMLYKFAELLQANSGNAVNERAAFQAAHKEIYGDIFRYRLLDNGKYYDNGTEIDWQLWQAARASLANKPDDWIFCTDRMPKREGNIGSCYRSEQQFLLCNEKGNVWTDYAYFGHQHPEWESNYVGIGVHYNYKTVFGAGRNVLAWKPLPKAITKG